MDGTTAHQQNLRAQHLALEKQITAETKRRQPDSLKLTELKKQKLRIKQELELEFS
jgi:hypothetical protein